VITMTDKPEEELEDIVLKEITKPEYVRMLTEASRQYKHSLRNLEVAYYKQVDKLNSYLEAIFTQYQETVLFEPDNVVSYYMNDKTSELMYKTRPKLKHIGFDNNGVN